MRVSVLGALAMATSATAHTVVYGIWVNGVDQGDGRNVYVRSPPSNNPVKDRTSPAMACNVNGGTVAPSFVKAAAGDDITVEWYHNSRGDDIIDPSHKGPLITYIAPYTTNDGTGPIWTKIAEDGFEADGTWAIDKIRSNGGKEDFKLPAGIPAGQYLLRQEIIALHEADVSYASNNARGAQFYPSCIQLEVTSGGSDAPNENFDINAGYQDDTGIVFNVYNGATTYPFPGPQVWSGAGGSETPAPAPVTPAPQPSPSAPAPAPENPQPSPSAPAPAPAPEYPQPSPSAPAPAPPAPAPPAPPAPTPAYPAPEPSPAPPAPAPAPPAPAPPAPAPAPAPECNSNHRFVRRSANNKVRRSFRTSPRKARRFEGQRA